MEFVVRIPFATPFYEVGGAFEHPTIHFFELVVWNRILCGIEVGEIAESEAEGVADFAIGFAELRHDALGHFYVGLVLDAGDPKAEKIGAPFFADFVRLNGVAERFGHRAALLIKRPALRDDAFVRRARSYADGDEK